MRTEASNQLDLTRVAQWPALRVRPDPQAQPDRGGVSRQQADVDAGRPAFMPMNGLVRDAQGRRHRCLRQAGLSTCLPKLGSQLVQVATQQPRGAGQSLLSVRHDRRVALAGY
jgi:hypothetical protein